MAKHRLGLINLPAHICVLRALAGEKEVDSRAVVGTFASLHAFAIALRKCLDGFGNIGYGGPATVWELATTDLQCPGDIGEAQVIFFFKIRGAIRPPLFP